MTMKKIFLIKYNDFTAPFFYYAICTNIVQYGFDHERPAFKFDNHIMVNRKVTRKEAEKLLELVKHNGTGQVCGGPPVETIEL